jgi:hypothetical protein
MIPTNGPGFNWNSVLGVRFLELGLELDVPALRERVSARKLLRSTAVVGADVL